MSEIQASLSGPAFAAIGIGVALLGIIIIALIVIRSTRSQTALDSRTAHFLESLQRGDSGRSSPVSDRTSHSHT